MLATNDIEISFTMNNNIFEFDSLYIITRINWTKTDTNDYILNSMTSSQNIK